MGEQPAGLVGRDEEWRRLVRSLDAERPAAVLIEGEAGIGKTTLWRSGVVEAGRRGWRTLAFCPGEAERSLTLAGLSGLLADSVLEEILPALPEPRRRALDAALLRADGEASPNAATVGLAVQSVVAELSRSAPLLLAVDDLQWLDEPTVQVLEFALRRLDGADVLLLAARRVGDDVAARPSLERAFPEARRERLSVGPLTAGAIGRLVHQRLGLALPRPLAVRIRQETSGNPFLALETARALRGRFPAPGQPLPVPPDSAALLRRRIERLTPDGKAALAAVSALARPGIVMLSRAYGDEPAERGVAELVTADLVRVDGEELRASHPLVASAAYGSLLPAARRRLHRRLAGVVDDVEERARHLALAADGPSPDVAAALDEAAALARRRGQLDAAAELAELAVQRTPPGDPAALARRSLALARARLGAGSPATARVPAARAVELLPPGPRRVDALILLGKIDASYLGDVPAGKRSFAEALDEATGDPFALARAHASVAGWDEDVGDSWEVRAAHWHAAAELIAGREDEDPEAAASVLLGLVNVRLREGHGLDRALLERALAMEPKLRCPVLELPSVQGAGYLGRAGLHAASRRAIEDSLALAERVGDWAVRPILLRFLGLLAWWTGDLDEAWVRIREAREAADEVGVDAGQILAAGGLVLAARGELAEARTWCDLALAKARELGHESWEGLALAASGFLLLTGGDAAAAAEALAAGRTFESRTQNREAGWDRFRGHLIEALASSGRLDEAERETSELEADAAQSGHPWSLVVAARCRGLLDAASGRLEEALAGFARSLEADPQGELAFERARTLLAKGQTLLRANRRRAARETLDDARELFERCGSPPWAAKAAAELGRIGGRAGDRDALTAMERRVAELVSGGRSNRETAQELFVSVRTVESHLSSAYRKLGVRSRTALAAVLREEEPNLRGSTEATPEVRS